MAAIVNQTDKRSGITYAYQSVSYWDKEKKQSRAMRTLIGRVDKETGEIIQVVPSKAQSNKYTHFPIHCYMQYEVKDKWNSIINILEIDDSDYTFVGEYE